jgi:hypothetical protein
MNRMISLALVCTLAACGNTAGNTGDDGSPDASTQGHPDAVNPTAKPTIFTIVLENHDYAEIIGSSNAPYINSLLAQGALATNYKDTIHPSLGNYLYMISGDNQYPGGIDVDPTFSLYFPANKPNLGSQLEAAQIPWRAYQETMGTPCKLTSAGKYAPKHNPFVYFTDIQTNSTLCNKVDVDYGNFAADLAANTYRFMWVTPNLDSDGHDPSTDQALGARNSDTWMSHEVPKILNSDGFKAGGVLFITWDEAEGRSGHDPDKIPMIILSPKVKQPGMTSGSSFTHASYLTTVEELLGLPRLATVTTKPTMMEFMNP